MAPPAAAGGHRRRRTAPGAWCRATGKRPARAPPMVAIRALPLIGFVPSAPARGGDPPQPLVLDQTAPVGALRRRRQRVAGVRERRRDRRGPGGLRAFQQFRLEDGVECEPLAERGAASGGVGQQHLRHRQGHGVDQRGAPFGPLARRELGQQAPHGGGDADGMGGGEHGDAVVRGPHHRLHRLAVARFAYDHGRRPPPEAGTQPVSEAREVAGDLGGRHQRGVGGDAVEDVFDRRFVGLDAPGAALQQPARAGGQQGGLARARHPGDQGEPRAELPGPHDLVLDAQLLEGRRLAGQHTERDVDRESGRALHRREVAAEALPVAPGQLNRMGAVDGAAGAQDALAGGVVDALAEASHDRAVEAGVRRALQSAVDLDEGRAAGLEGDVGGAPVGGPQQELVQPVGREAVRGFGPEGLVPVLRGGGHRIPSAGGAQRPASSSKRAGRAMRAAVSPILTSRSWPETRSPRPRRRAP